MRIRRLTIERFRALETLTLQPGPCTVVLGPNNAGKSSILEALDLLLHGGLGRPRPGPSDVDYYGRNPSAGFEIEAVIGDLHGEFLADVRHHLEGWDAEHVDVVPEPDGDGIEPVVRVRVRGDAEFEVVHEFAKPESDGARFTRGLRAQVGWIFDGRARDPAYQLAFYQGGALDRLFGDVNLDVAVEHLRLSLANGAQAVNAEDPVVKVLGELGADLRKLGLLGDMESPLFEASAVSTRELLQAMRLALPSNNVAVPLARQGRGAQRLLLVSVLLRLATAGGRVPIAGLEEPEEALEPLRQAQVSKMLRAVADSGGQVFVVTHSTEVARAFELDDFVLMRERSAGADVRILRGALAPPVRQAYERRLDGTVVRGLFARVPVLVEGPSDRAIFETFWAHLATEGRVSEAHAIGLDVVNAEGAENIPMLAAVLDAAGKAVVAWAEKDSENVMAILDRLRNEGHCSAIMTHGPTPERANLERAIGYACEMSALVAGMRAVALDRGYDWAAQRSDLLSRCEGIAEELRESAKRATSLEEFFDAIGEPQARPLIVEALSAKAVTPFELKGARQARTLATAIVGNGGVPSHFADAFLELNSWIADGCATGTTIEMARG